MAEEYREMRKQALDLMISEFTKDKPALAIDSLTIRESLKHMDPDKWVREFNNIKKIHASLPDYYRAARCGDDKYLRYLRHSFCSDLTVTGTRPDYGTSRITHYYGSELVRPMESEALKIPNSIDPIGKIVKTDEGLKLLQILFLTKDNPEEIVKTLERLTEKKSNNILLWPADQFEREKKEDMAAALYNSNEGFFIHLNFPTGCPAKAHSVEFIRLK